MAGQATPPEDEYAGAVADPSVSGPPVDDGYGGAVPMQSAGGNVATAGQSAAKSFLETAGPAAGAASGVALGAMTGPAAPVAVPLFGLMGLGAGYVAGKMASSGAGLKSPEELPPEQRPAAYAGEAVGGALPFTAGTVGLAKAGVRSASPFIDKILDYAAEHPISFARTETAAALAAGGAGMGSEIVRPGEALPRVGAEVAAGFLSPTRLLSSAFGGAWSYAKRAVSALSTSGNETMAAQYLQRVVKDFGDDPDTLATLLSQPGLLPGVTSAQKSGDPALIALEQNLAKSSLSFGQQAKKTAEDAMTAMKNLIEGLKGTGDPAALQEAGNVRDTYFRTLLSGRIQTAEAEATRAAAEITDDTPQARAALGQKAVELVQGALSDARAAERALWDKVPTDVPAAADNVIAAAENLKSRMLPEESLPDLVQRFVTRMQGEGNPENARAAAEALFSGGAAKGAVEPTTTGELKILRSRMLTSAREAEAQGRYGDASAYGKVAEAALADLGAAADRAGGSEAFDEARTFSRELHDTFTRTFANDATATARNGAERVPPEVYLRKALGAGAEAGDVRLQQLQDATDFMAAHGLNTPEAAARTADMADAQERIVRLAAGDFVNPQTGRVNTNGLSRWVENNASILDRFPAVRQTLQSAVDTEQGAKDLVNVYTGGQRIIDREAAFSRIANVDSPVDAVSKAIRSAQPETQLTQYVKLAKQGGADAEAGLRSALFQDAINRSTKGDAIDFTKLDEALNKPLRDGLPSVVDVMQKNGLMQPDEIGRLNKIIEEGTRLNAAGKTGAALKGDNAVPSPLIETMIRIAGSKIGGKISEALGGQSTLIANSAGSKYLLDKFHGLGANTAQGILIHAAEDPKFMAMLLRKPATQEESIRLAQNIHAYALAAGLSSAKQEQPGSP